MQVLPVRPIGPTPPPSFPRRSLLRTSSSFFPTHLTLHPRCTLPSPASIVVCFDDAHKPDLCACYLPLSLSRLQRPPPVPTSFTLLRLLHNSRAFVLRYPTFLDCMFVPYRLLPLRHLSRHSDWAV